MDWFKETSDKYKNKRCTQIKNERTTPINGNNYKGHSDRSAFGVACSIISMMQVHWHIWTAEMMMICHTHETLIINYLLTCKRVKAKAKATFCVDLISIYRSYSSDGYSLRPNIKANRYQSGLTRTHPHSHSDTCRHPLLWSGDSQIEISSSFANYMSVDYMHPKYKEINFNEISKGIRIENRE